MIRDVGHVPVVPAGGVENHIIVDRNRISPFKVALEKFRDEDGDAWGLHGKSFSKKIIYCTSFKWEGARWLFPKLTLLSIMSLNRFPLS